MPVQTGAVFLAIFIYAVLGVPAPDAPGLAEILIGGLLLVSVGFARGLQVLDPGRSRGWEQAAGWLLIYGLTVPVLGGLAAGNGAAAIVRDMIAYLFLLLPLFMIPLFEGRQGRINGLTALVVCLGLVFSLRVLCPALLTPGLSVPDPFLLANAPTVLFSALFLAGLGGWGLYRGRVLRGGVPGMLALIPLATMALIMQRASIGVFCLTLLVLAAIGLIRRPLRVVLPLLALAALALSVWPLMQDIVQTLAHKTALVGFNRRGDEALAVLRELDGSLLTVLFGKGWGAAIASPAVGGAVVTFTHSLFTTYWLKSGLVGLLLVTIYLGWFALMLFRLLPRFPVMALALAGPFLIDIFLYASFKSLDFGLVLLLIPLWSVPAERLQTGGFCSSDKASPE